MTAEIPAAFVAGAGAGIGVALPLGAVGVLLLHEGLLHGWRPAAAGATAVATVDLVYAATAVVLGGAAAAALQGHERAVGVTAGAVLVAIAAWGLRGLRRPASPAAGVGGSGPSPFLRFAGLTLVNPLTVTYFVVVAAGLGRRVDGAPGAAAFVMGVFVASWAWQLVLATAGAAAGLRAGARLRRWSGIAGYAVVAAYGVHLAAA